MTDSVFEDVVQVVRDRFDEYEGPITPALTAADVAQWDSLAHVQFMVTLEQIFHIRFRSEEINGFANLGELTEAIRRKMAGS